MPQGSVLGSLLENYFSRLDEASQYYADDNALIARSATVCEIDGAELEGHAQLQRTGSRITGFNLIQVRRRAWSALLVSRRQLAPPLRSNV